MKSYVKSKRKRTEKKTTQKKKGKKEEKKGKIGAKEASQVLLNVIEKSYGIQSDVVDESPSNITCKIGKCPVFESAQALGMDVKDIEATCRASAIVFMDSIAKQLNPDLSYQLTKFRTSADDCCEENIQLS